MIRRTAAALAAVATTTILAVAGAAPAFAAPVSTTTQGQVLRLVSIQDAEAMTSMTPGVPVSWDIGVSASRGDGTIDVRLDVDATDGAFGVTVASCDEAWSAEGCANGAQVLAAATLEDGTVELGEQPSGVERWYRVAVTLTADIGAHRADLVFRAHGMGDDLASGGAVELPRTAVAVPGLGLALASAAVAAGVLIAVAASRRRREGAQP